MYQLVAAEQGIAVGKLSGTVQNDVLKEYIARGTYIYPPRESLRLASDIFAYCQQEIPRWNTISISGYHMAEAGATPVQEIAFTIANAKEYVRAALAAGLDIDGFAPRLSFFFVARTTLLEAVAKFRAARRIWARITRDEFRAKNPKSQMLRFHTQTAGVLEAATLALIKAVEDRGGAVAAIEQGFQKAEIEAAAYRVAQEIDTGPRTVAGVNRFVAHGDEPYEPLRVDPRIEADQCERLAVLRGARQPRPRALSDLRRTAVGTANVLPAMREALALQATGGETALRDVWASTSRTRPCNGQAREAGAI